MNRTARAALAQETLAIVERGRYDLADGKTVSIADEVRSCVDGTQLLRPEGLARLQEEVLSQPGQSRGLVIEVVNETTLAGVSRLLRDHSAPVAALNFASAKNPGGGFLSGSQAQEESLARSSALHASQMKAWDFYEQHRQGSSALYSDSMILSPGCPVFRDDSGKLLREIQLVTFISAAAPNAGAVAANTPEDVGVIPEVLARRAEYVLALAASHGYRHLVLGAWGCGVFRNEPQVVADVFMTLLQSARWINRFSRVVFSILDPTPDEALVNVFKAAAERERHTVFLIGGDENETAIITTSTEGENRCIRFSYRGRTIDARASDYFEALCRVRQKLENEGLIPFCYGASLNVYPSGMARDMGAGLKAYRMTEGKHARLEDLVYIFATGPDVVPAYVSAQREFFEAWLAGPRR